MKHYYRKCLIYNTFDLRSWGVLFKTLQLRLIFDSSSSWSPSASTSSSSSPATSSASVSLSSSSWSVKWEKGKCYSQITINHLEMELARQDMPSLVLLSYKSNKIWWIEAHVIFTNIDCFSHSVINVCHLPYCK
jgi:hypothetical protein